MTDVLKRYLTARLGGNADGPTDDDTFWQDPLVRQTADDIDRAVETIRQQWQRPDSSPEPVGLPTDAAVSLAVTPPDEPTPAPAAGPIPEQAAGPIPEQAVPTSDTAIAADSHQSEPTATVAPVLSPTDTAALPEPPAVVLLADSSPHAMPRFGADQPTQPPASPPAKAIVLPNATVGKGYEYVFDVTALGLPDLDTHSLDVADPGLTYDAGTFRLSGTPTQPGEFGLTLTYRPRTDQPDRPALTRPVTLLVNPDPRSLWKNLPSDTTDPYYKPDEAHEGRRIGDVRLLAASVRGRSHAHEGIFRDDDFGLAEIAETGWFLVTVADGAGSAKYSRKGAQLACQTLTQTVRDAALTDAWAAFDAAAADAPGADAAPGEPVVLGKPAHDQLYAVLGKGVFAAYKAIEAEAVATHATIRDYATTLLTTLARPQAGGWLVGAFMVGDGGIGVYRAGQSPVLLGTPDGGEFAGQTRFLTMSDTFDAATLFGRFRFVWVPDMTALVLMTDGVTDPKFQTDSNLGRAESWADLWADLTTGVDFADDASAPARLQEWLNFWSPGNHDDRTIALLYDHPQAHA
jgi:Protein phosphatase 2C